MYSHTCFNSLLLKYWLLLDLQRTFSMPDYNFGIIVKYKIRATVSYELYDKYLSLYVYWMYIEG